MNPFYLRTAQNFETEKIEFQMNDMMYALLLGQFMGPYIMGEAGNPDFKEYYDELEKILEKYSVEFSGQIWEIEKAKIFKSLKNHSIDTMVFAENAKEDLRPLLKDVL